jgi:hypothetical protein
MCARRAAGDTAPSTQNKTKTKLSHSRRVMDCSEANNIPTHSKRSTLKTCLFSRKLGSKNVMDVLG